MFPDPIPTPGVEIDQLLRYEKDIRDWKKLGGPGMTLLLAASLIIVRCRPEKYDIQVTMP